MNIFFRVYFKSVFFVIVLILAYIFFYLKTVQASEKLNVLFIAVDDLRPELSCYGVETLKTPNFERLAKSGVLFNKAYCQQAVCGASRLSIMSGRYPLSTGEQTFHVSNWRERHPNLITMNQHFMQNGYKTIGLGKIYHSRNGKDADFKQWNQIIHIREHMYVSPENRENRKKLREQRILGPFGEALDLEDEHYIDAKRTTKAIETLKELSLTKEPFFLGLGFLKPHLPFVAPKKYWDLYNPDDFKMPKNKGVPPGYPEYASNKSSWELEFYSDYEGNSPTEFSKKLNQHLWHGYAACTSFIDACLGRLLDTLDETGLAKNTIIVLWGDHGYKLGEHSRWTKHTNFEVDTRVPLIVRVPNKTQNKTSQSLVELIDLYPTLCELVGLETPFHCQGTSFANLLDHPQNEHRTSAYSTYPAQADLSEKLASGFNNGPVMPNANIAIGHSIRFDKYRYTEWRPKPSQKATASVLTNLEDNPGETSNLIGIPEYASVVKKANSILNNRIAFALKKQENNN